MKLVRGRDPPPSEPKKRFTEPAKLRTRLNEQRLAGMRVATAMFGEGGRTFWHRHHGEQGLYVLCGKGWVRKIGEKAQAIESGDVVYVAPGEKHWHGAQAGHNLEHLAGDELPEELRTSTGRRKWLCEAKQALDQESTTDHRHLATPVDAARQGFRNATPSKRLRDQIESAKLQARP